MSDCGSADLNQMHKLNEEAYINPEQWQRRTMERQPPPPDPTERVSGTVQARLLLILQAELWFHVCGSVSVVPCLWFCVCGSAGFTCVQTSQFARGNVFANQPSQQQLQQQDKYKAYLKQQVLGHGASGAPAG